MCGLVGIMGEPHNNMTNLFIDMLYADIIRGKDSTGVAAISPGVCHIIKEEGLPYKIIRDSNFKKHVNPSSKKPDKYVFMGHNRAATKGAVNKKNAHPHVHGNIVLTHNGTLNNHHIFPKPKDVKYWESDSDALTHFIHDSGIEEVWKEMNGAAAIVWWDLEKQTLNMLRNDKRPLCFAYSNDRKYLLYASENWMIQDFAWRRGIQVPSKNVFSPNPNFLFTFRYDLQSGEIIEENKELEPRPLPELLPGPDNFLGYGVYEEWEGYGNLHRHLKKDELYGSNLFTSKEKRVPHKLSESAFLKKYKKCFFCNSPLEPQFEEAVILSETDAACADCVLVGDMNGVPVEQSAFWW